jgi:hypothetical protein
VPTSLVLDDPAFEVADLADKLSEQTEKRLRAFVKDRAERYKSPHRDRAQTEWLRARESVNKALAGLLADQAELRDALKRLHDAGQRVMDAGETGQGERFRKFVNDRTNPLRAAEIAEGVHWTPEELTHVRRAPYDNHWEDLPAPSGHPDAQNAMGYPQNGSTNVWLAAVNDGARVDASAWLGVWFRPQIYSGRAQFRPRVTWHADGAVNAYGNDGNAYGGFQMMAESWDLRGRDYRVEAAKPLPSAWTCHASGVLYSAIASLEGVLDQSNGGVLDVHVTSQRIYQFWIECGAHVDATGLHTILNIGSQATASFMTATDWIVIQEFPGP